MQSLSLQMKEHGVLWIRVLLFLFECVLVLGFGEKVREARSLELVNEWLQIYHLNNYNI